jgi:DNA-binding XRE family transcriptional regulator
MKKKQGMTPTELRKVRIGLNFTQEKLAFELGVVRLSVIRWEAGTHRIPRMLTLALMEIERERCL